MRAKLDWNMVNAAALQTAASAGSQLDRLYMSCGLKQVLPNSTTPALPVSVGTVGALGASTLQVVASACSTLTVAPVSAYVGRAASAVRR